MELYLIRHAEYEYNLKGLCNYTKSIKVPLTEKGIEQATALKEVLGDAKIEAVFSSPLERAVQTTKIVFPGIPVVFDPDLRDTFTTLEGESAKPFFEALQKDPVHGRIGSGESFSHVYERVSRSIKRILNYEYKPLKYRRVAVVSHGHPLNAIIAYLNGIPLEEAGKWKMLGNCEYHYIDTFTKP